MLGTWNLLHKGGNGRHTAQEYGNNEGNHTKGQFVHKRWQGNGQHLGNMPDMTDLGQGPNTVKQEATTSGQCGHN